MRLPHVSILLALALAAGAVGCARTGAFTSRPPWGDKPSSYAASQTGKKTSVEDPSSKSASKTPPEAEESPPETVVAKEDKKAVPGEADSAEKAESIGSPKTSSIDGRATNGPEAETTDATNSASASPVDLDTETLALMNEHLKNVPFAERKKLYQEWKSLDAETIRERIRQRESKAESETENESKTSEIPEEFLPKPAADSNAPADTADSDGSDEEDSTITDSQVTPAAFEVAARDNTGATDDAEPARPVPLMDEILQESAEAPSSQPLSSSPSQSDWDGQIQRLVTQAEARAETAHQLFLESQSSQGEGGAGKESGTDAKTQEALRRDYIASAVDVRLLYMIAGERGRALQVIPDIAAAEQEYWRQIFWSLASYFDVESLPDRSERITQTIEQLRSAIAKLQGEAKLTLRNVAFCRKITSFGNFERFDEDTYSAGQKILLYAEIVNFKSVPNESDGLFKTQLKSTIEILPRGEDEPLQRIAFDPTVDLCRSHRQDYFHSYELRLPDELEPGAYVLKLTVEDVQSDDMAVYTLNFTIE